MKPIFTQDYTTFERFDRQIRSNTSDESVVTDYDIIRQYIRDASRFFANTTRRSYVPYDFTHEVKNIPENFSYDGRFLWLPDDCFAISVLTSTDGTTISSSLYRFSHQYLQTHYQIEINPNARLTTVSNDNFRQRYEITGTWGYHQDYDEAWEASTTLDGAIDDSVTTIRVASVANLERLQYLKIDSEYMQITGAIPTSAPLDLTVKRGVNGSSATAHDNSSVVSYWWVESDVNLAVTRLAVGLYRTRTNAGSQLRFIDGTVLVEGDEKSMTKIASYLHKSPRLLGA